jgi:hypothetical protein
MKSQDLEALKEEIRRVLDGLDGSDIAHAAACLVLDELRPAQGKGWGWVFDMLDSCRPYARQAAAEVAREIEELNQARRSPDLARFQHWLKESAPYLNLLWHWEKRELDLGMVESYIATASHGQAVMCRFAAGVWLGSNDYQFDLISAAGVLDDEQKAAIAAWFTSPFWP